MSSDPAIRLEKVSKAYQVYKKWNDRMYQVVFGSFKQFYRHYWVLEDVDLEIGRNECVGIVGRNGAGKSTLLQVICGITDANRGKIRVEGRIAPILSLGEAFDRDLTGRENLLIGGVILGLTRKEIHAKFDEIAAFAEIGDYMDRPVKYFSTGMITRLAFAICANVDAQILIVDEALAVGDTPFQRKSLDYIREFRKTGTAILVSHELHHIRDLCERTIWIDGSGIRADGPTEEVLRAYEAEMSAQPRPMPTRLFAD